MDKIEENEFSVLYRFETDIDAGVKINERGKLRSSWETKYGYCKFNKQTEEFELDKEKTDSYFTEKSREVIKVQCNLIRRKRENLGYPEIIDIATPG